MTNLPQILRYLAASPVLVLNGLLYLLYALVDHVWLWIILACGLAILFGFDLASVRLVSSAPSRIGGRPAPITTTGWGTWAYTLVALVAGTTAVLRYADPIPFIFAAMWVAAVVALVLLPAEREPILGRVKGLLLLYALALLAFQFFLSQAQSASPEEWAAVVGSVGSARDSLARTRDTFTTIGMLGVWYGIPFAYFSYVAQRLLNNPQSNFHSRKSIEEIVADLRQRR